MTYASNHKQLLITRLTQYVQHKAILFQKSKRYNNLQYAASLSACIRLTEWLKSRSEKGISKLILTHRQHLQQILPAPNNYSYQNSLHALENIIQIAKNITSNDSSGKAATA